MYLSINIIFHILQSWVLLLLLAGYITFCSCQKQIHEHKPFQEAIASLNPNENQIIVFLILFLYLFFNLFPLQLANIQYSIINYNHHAVYYISMTYLLYNWRLVHFDVLHLFQWANPTSPSPLTPISSNHQSVSLFCSLYL